MKYCILKEDNRFVYTTINDQIADAMSKGCTPSGGVSSAIAYGPFSKLGVGFQHKFVTITQQGMSCPDNFICPKYPTEYLKETEVGVNGDIIEPESM
jgi:hypothetical protein